MSTSDDLEWLRPLVPVESEDDRKDVVLELEELLGAGGLFAGT
jgi:hypothetical protein